MSSVHVLVYYMTCSITFIKGKGVVCVGFRERSKTSGVLKRAMPSTLSKVV